MSTPVSNQIRDAAEELARLGASPDRDIGSALNRVLNRFLSWPLRASPGTATDIDGRTTEKFASLIHTGSPAGQQGQQVNVPADTMACAIDVSESVDLERFRVSYRKISQAKTLKKTPPPRAKDVPVSNTTLGIIFVANTALPVEQLAEELDALNRRTPSPQWPDMVVVFPVGVINYAVQFPEAGLAGDFLPPEEGAVTSYTLPAYVVVVMRPTRQFTLNKMLAFILGHLSFFSPGVKLPDWSEVTRGIPQEAIVLRGYQYNLKGELLPVPREFYSDRYIPPQPFLIEDRKGNVLSQLQFIPWQDGGVILLKGKLPLSGILVFLGGKTLERGGVLKPPNAPDTQISYVLPITHLDFINMIRRLQRQSNMIVRRPPGRLVVQKVAEEGSSSPFIARIFIGVFHLRDAALSGPSERWEFDKAYEFVAANLQSARSSSGQIIQMLSQHERKVSEGGVGRIKGQTIYIDESVDNPLRKEVSSFLDSAVRALKDGMQKVTKTLYSDIGFLFGKDKLFEKGLEGLAKTDPALAAYLGETRKWSSQLIRCRNSMHGGWMLPAIKYSVRGNGIALEEPQITGQRTSEFVRFMADRVVCFVEEVTAHCLQMRMHKGISITEIALSKRSIEMPERFRLSLVDGQTPLWKIVYHQSPFDKT